MKITPIESLGPWAIVTGASAGIGLACARRLAARGLNLVLVARRADALATTCDDLTREYGVATRAIAQDLSAPAAAAAVMRACADLDVGLLISNAGNGRMGGFLQNAAPDLREMLMLNVITQMELTHAFASRLIERGRTGGILIVSSTFAFGPVPLGANYAAAKAYLLRLGEALHAELGPRNVHVSVLVPGTTNTPGLNQRDDLDVTHSPMPQMSPDVVVAVGLRALERGRPSRVPGLLNRLMIRLIPQRLGTWMWQRLLRRMLPPHLLPEARLAEPRGMALMARSA